MSQNKEFFTYAYLILLRGMTDDKNKKRELLDKIYEKEDDGHGLELLCEMNTFMHKYGLNMEHLK